MLAKDAVGVHFDYIVLHDMMDALDRSVSVPRKVEGVGSSPARQLVLFFVFLRLACFRDAGLNPAPKEGGGWG